MEYDKLIFELSTPGAEGMSLPILDVPEVSAAEVIGQDFLRKNAVDLPEVAEPEVIRHFVALSSKNHHIDKNMYPLGSCTMKYNPKINENLARLSGFTEAHPHFSDNMTQGTLALLYELQEMLKEISGMEAITLQPVAGAHGEFTALLIIRAYHQHNKRNPTKVVLPDSAHGTNPASVVMAGYDVIQIPSNSNGRVDLQKLAEVCNDDMAAFMITNPNTLGLYELEIKDIAQLVHNCGAMLYMDGANLNALLGLTRPGDSGFDIMHFNMHKTFSTPHGGGGPGAGALGMKANLEPFMPSPVIAKKVDTKGNTVYYLDNKRPLSIGAVHSFYGNIAVLIRAYCYIRQNGGPGLREVSEAAIINAMYLREKLRQRFDLPYAGRTLHEFVLSGNKQKALGVRTADIAKRILDFGVHSPTVYFPLIVPEAIMIEPTESESKASLDNFIEIMFRIADEVENNPDYVKSAPHDTPVSRLDEASAAREPDICFKG
ncbi:MAG TPA: aminomethyl-transferring glycine dehydrogenase subunit GcvPB [candidate division Zixibacteria bacterium]|nr:aminomethyl-transferring glycine dehydrogenase subunit GcvPB [candidate division Zixibacteria bacterium]